MIKQANILFQSNLYESKNPTRRWIHQKRRAWVSNKFTQLSSLNATVLEIGTGCGTYTDQLAYLFDEITSIDINTDFIEAVKFKLPKVNAMVANIETFNNFKKYDVIIMSEVLEHVSNTKVSLDNVFRHLKTGGIFILTTPNKFSTTELIARLLKISIFAHIARKIYGEPVDELGHISLRTRGQLMTELENAGFKIISREDIAFYLPVIAEFGGETGKRVLEYIEQLLQKNNMLRNMLWTQCYVLTKECE